MNRLMVYILSGVFLLSSLVSEAATISGCIIDDQQSPVEYATIVFLKDGKQVGGTTSNDEGCFSQKINNGNYELRISYVGLESYIKQIAVNGNMDLDKITLKHAATGLKEVTVTASPIRREADRYIMQVENQPTTIGKDGEELLKQAPGVWINQDDQISINGNGGTKVYINDREQDMSDAQLMNFLRTLRAEDVSRIIVIPRAGAEYSANTSGGIIKIYLKTNRDDGVMGNVGAAFEAEKYRIGLSPYATLNVKHGKFTVNSSAWLYMRPKSQEGAIEKTTSANSILDASSLRDAPNQTYAGGKLGTIYDFNKNNSIGFEGQFFVNHDPQDLKTNSRYSSNGILTTTDSRYNKAQEGYNLNLKFNYVHKLDTIGSTLKLYATYTYDHGRSNSDNTSSIKIADFSPIDSLSREMTKSRYNIVNVSGDYEKIFNPNWKLMAGAKYTLNDMYNYSYVDYQKNNKWIPVTGSNYNINYDENIYALYAIANFNYGRWQIKGGVRGEYTHSVGSGGFISRNYFDLFPNANVNYNITEKGDYSIGLGYSRTIERPSFWSLSPIRYQISDYSYQTGNPLLKPSYQNQFDLNLSLAYRYNIAMGLSMTNDGMNMRMQVDPKDPQYAYATWFNESNTRTFYTNVFAPIPITKWLTVTPNLTYVIRAEKSTKEALSYAYRHMFYANCNISVTLPKSFFFETSIFCNNKFTSSNFTNDANVWWNASVKKTFSNNKWVASFGVNNILCNANRITARSETFTRVYKLKHYSTFRVSLTYNFNSGKKFQARSVESNEDASRLSKGNDSGMGGK